jgi:hypothetical protein
MLDRGRRIQQPGFDLELGRLHAVPRSGEDLFGSGVACIEQGVDVDAEFRAVRQEADIDHMNDAQAGGQPLGETDRMSECVCGTGASVYGDQDL